MVNKHFFKPLLPDFHSHLTIPIAFFLKYIQGRNEHKLVKLRSDASKITWEVKIEDGFKLTDGWKEFALAHDLRTGDILIFRQEDKDMMSFHVTLLGPSCCEIQYDSCLDHENNLNTIHRLKKKKQNLKRQGESSSLDSSFFVSNVLASTLRYDTLYFPKRFVRENGLETGCGEIVLMNEKGTSWTLALKQKPSCGTMYCTRGWRSFCRVNKLKAGASFTFKLIQGGRTLVLRLSTKSEEEEESSEGDEVEYLSTRPEKKKIKRKKRVKKKPNKETKSSSLGPSYFVANVSPATLRYDLLCLPVRFVRENGLETGCGEIVLMNEKGTSCTVALKQKPSSGIMYITRGWRRFCRLNGLKAGGSFIFKLIKGGRTLVLRLSTTNSVEEEEQQSLEGDEAEYLSNNEEINLDKKIHRKEKVKKNSNREAECSSLDPSCFVAYVSPATLRYDILNLPRIFARVHGLNKRSGKIVLVNKKGKSWTLDLKGKKSCGTTYIRRGWRSFCSDNELRAGSFHLFKLIQRGGTLALRLLSPAEEEECAENDEIESLSTETESDEESYRDEKRSFKKRRLTWKASSSSYQNRFVTLTLKEYFIKKSIMFLPLSFTRMNDIDEETKMTLVDINGVQWSTKLRSEIEGDRKRLVGGWKDFFKANNVKIGESIMLELIWEGDTSCILKFCSKVKQETI